MLMHHYVMAGKKSGNKMKIYTHALLILLSILLALAHPGVAYGQGAIRPGYETVCADFDRVLAEKNVSNANYCGVAISLDDPRYSLPDWQDLDPLENIEIVKTMYYWKNGISGARSHELFPSQMQDVSKIIPELMDLYWPKAEAQVLDFIARGEVVLLFTMLDADGDGDEETVYRMSPLVRLGGAIPPWEREEHRIIVQNNCVDVGLPGGDRSYIYYIFPGELARQNFGNLFGPGMDKNGLFLHQGKIFWTARSTLLLPEESGIVGFSQVCDGL